MELPGLPKVFVNHLQGVVFPFGIRPSVELVEVAEAFNDFLEVSVNSYEFSSEKGKVFLRTLFPVPSDIIGFERFEWSFVVVFMKPSRLSKYDNIFRAYWSMMANFSPVSSW